MTTRRPPAVGIDLGTTFSAVAALDESGRPETVRNSEGSLTTPSVVFFDRQEPIVGVEAVEAGLLEPERLAMCAKRDIGESHFQKKILGESLPPEVVESLILRKLKSDAELSLGSFDSAVITVPAFFNEPCRKATQDAGLLAGLNVLDIINEPTAAAITYGVRGGFLTDKGESTERQRVLVYDLGGGTFDVTVMEINGADYTTIATAGDVYLGGMDWDARLVELIATRFQEQHALDPREDPSAEQELNRKANQVKHALTQRESSMVAFAHNGQRLRMELTRQQFADATMDLVERTLMTVRLVMDEAGLKFTDLNELILVGGSTRMPMIRQELEQLSGLEVNRSLSPDEAVCHGAAIYAGILQQDPDARLAKLSVSNVNSHDLGVLAVDPSTGNPRRAIMIPRNSKLPAQKEIRFRTFRDSQPNVKIHVVEGGDNAGEGATTLGKCYVHPLPSKTPKGTEVDVRFSYSKDGRLRVSAKLPSLKRKVETVIQRASGLKDQELLEWRERLDNGIATPDRTESECSAASEVDALDNSSSDNPSLGNSSSLAKGETSAVSEIPEIVVGGRGKDTDSKSTAEEESTKDSGTAPVVAGAPVIRSAPVIQADANTQAATADTTAPGIQPADDSPEKNDGSSVDDAAALAAFLQSSESGVAGDESSKRDAGSSAFAIDTSPPDTSRSAGRKKLRRAKLDASEPKEQVASSDWKSRRKRFS